MSLGPVMLDLRGEVLERDEREILEHPLVGGVILFSRNFSSTEQLQQLTRDIHDLRHPPLLIAVDQEGGRVQRFREGFTRLPACACYGALYDRNREQALAAAENGGRLMAMELLCAGVDFSFAPVLDLDHGLSQVIGDRAFHGKANAVFELAGHFCRGMQRAGMPAIGKHFPGHGGVREDSHHEVPVDPRRFQDIVSKDMLPFERLINTRLQGIMPAHVIYPDVDEHPAGFSAHWLNVVLRGQLGFQGTIFSDDLSMAGAEILGSYTQRAEAALQAGCDMLLICNNQNAAVKVLQTLGRDVNPASQLRLIRMHGREQNLDLMKLRKQADWQQLAASVSRLERAPELDFEDDDVPG